MSDEHDKPWRLPDAKPMTFDEMAARAQYEWQRAEDAEAEARQMTAERDALKEQVAAMEEGLTAVHFAGYMDGKEARKTERDALAEKLARAAEAAALRRAADVVAHFYSKGQVTKPEDLLALISPDAQGALDQMLAAERAEGRADGMEQAAKIVESLWAHRTCQEVADAIRAQKDSPT